VSLIRVYRLKPKVTTACYVIVILVYSAKLFLPGSGCFDRVPDALLGTLPVLTYYVATVLGSATTVHGQERRLRE
jgi:hypothetical protein